jgi:hypothetical protein
MTNQTQLTTKSFFTPALGKRMLIGAGIGLVIIGFFVISTGKGNAAWSNYWRVKPLLLTPFLGAIVGACFDVTEPLRRIEGWMGKIFFILSLLGYFIGLWMSVVLGAAGTMWN